jgi:NAD+--dinitrogen-reductase ADP-D-ribosyltransferase
VNDDPGQPAQWTSTNLVGVPAPLLASTVFNAHPVDLHIAGTREAHAGLFALLASSGDATEAGEMFAHYLSLAFGLQPAEAPSGEAERRRWRASYIKLLQSWGQDSNGPAGAVLKGWVESRFGLVPCFHKARLERFPSPPWVRYLEQKASSRFHNNCIQQQIDLLYEFCQWALLRYLPFGPAATDHVPLWRGITRCEEQIVSGDLHTHQARRGLTVRLNNLVSFSTRAEHAECFGDWVLAVQVPRSKLLFYPGLLPQVPLAGEGEVLALGGDYEVVARYD